MNKTKNQQAESKNKKATYKNKNQTQNPKNNNQKTSEKTGHKGIAIRPEKKFAIASYVPCITPAIDAKQTRTKPNDKNKMATGGEKNNKTSCWNPGSPQPGSLRLQCAAILA